MAKTKALDLARSAIEIQQDSDGIVTFGSRGRMRLSGVTQPRIDFRNTTTTDGTTDAAWWNITNESNVGQFSIRQFGQAATFSIQDYAPNNSIFVANSGNIGFGNGALDFDTSNANRALTVGKYSSIYSYETATTDKTFLLHNAHWTGANGWRRNEAAAASSIEFDGSDVIIRTTTSDVANSIISWTDVLNIDEVDAQFAVPITIGDSAPAANSGYGITFQSNGTGTSRLLYADINGVPNDTAWYGQYIDIDTTKGGQGQGDITANRTLMPYIHRANFVQPDNANTTSGYRYTLYGHDASLVINDTDSPGVVYDQISGYFRSYTYAEADQQNIRGILGGCYIQANANNVTRTINTAYGVQGIVQNNSANATVNNAYAGYFHVNQDDAGSIIDNGTSVYARVDRDNGTFNTGYCFRGSVEGVIGTTYGVYVNGEANNYFSGNMSVAGNLNLGGDLYIGTSSAAITDSVFVYTSVNEVLNLNSTDASCYIRMADSGTGTTMYVQAIGNYIGMSNNGTGRGFSLTSDGDTYFHTDQSNDGRVFAGYNPRTATYSPGERGFWAYGGASDDYTYMYARNVADTSPLFYGVVGGTARARIDADGDYQSASSTYGGTSDARLKENIVDSGSQWDDVKAMRVRKYSFIRDGLDAPNQLGVIAQELEESGMSGLVKTTVLKDEDRNPILDENGNEQDEKSVKYSILYMKAVKALQEAMERIETLEAKVEALENA